MYCSLLLGCCDNSLPEVNSLISNVVAFKYKNVIQQFT